MFFALSKILWFFVQPLNFAIFLGVAGLIAFLLRRPRAGFSLAFLGSLILVLSAWTSLGALMLSPLEERFSRPTLPDRLDGIVVLGGGFEGAINLARGGYELNSGGDRFVEAAVLARRFPDARIVISGGEGTLVLQGQSDTVAAEKMLTALGVTADRLILENKSRNTDENARFTKEMIAPKPGETWLLVTSAFHMPRSMALFRKAGFAVMPWPVDYRTSGREGVGLFRDNAADALQTTSTALREWVGLVAYYLSGRIDSVFPGPNDDR